MGIFSCSQGSRSLEAPGLNIQVHVSGVLPSVLSKVTFCHCPELFSVGAANEFVFCCGDLGGNEGGEIKVKDLGTSNSILS